MRPEAPNVGPLSPNLSPVIGVELHVLTTRTAYLYAVGHANGAATVIKCLGQAGSTFAAFSDNTYFRYYVGGSEAPPLYGE